MNKKSLYMYAILFHKRISKDEFDTTIIKEVSFTLANSQEEVKLIAATEIPKEYAKQMDQVEVIVRPF